MASKRPIEKTVFVVRSVAVENMDGALEACRKRWPEKELVAITDFECHPELVADSRISDAIVPNELSNGFRGAWLTNEQAEVVVVPVANRNGVGYANVFKFMKGVKAREWYLAQRGGTLKRVDFSTILRQVRIEWWSRILLVPVSYVLTFFMTRREPRRATVV
ncbi:MAG: hypothetical protein ACPGN3_13165 [Opitutales bacterium]